MIDDARKCAKTQDITNDGDDDCSFLPKSSGNKLLFLTYS